jgi:hypothetical protein
MNGRDGSVAASASSAPTVVDEAVAAADGMRAAARWIASGLGAIPSLAVLASIVRAPGSGGFDPIKLSVGVGLAALGAVTGVLLFAWVIAPVPLEDSDIRQLDLARIPGQPYKDFGKLDQDLDEIRQAAADKEHEVTQDMAAAKRAGVQAQQYELAAKDAEAQATASRADPALQESARKARARADQEQASAAGKAAAAEAGEVALGVWTAQLSRRDAVRQQAYRLKAADIVGERYLMARIGAVLSVALIASGVVLLGLAPSKPDVARPQAQPRLATLMLTPAGQRALHCPVRSIQALETGGSATAPIVITLPAHGCRSRTIVFTTAGPALGNVSVARPTGGS